MPAEVVYEDSTRVVRRDGDVQWEERKSFDVAAADAERADARAWRDAIRNAASLAELKAVLAGDSDAPGQAERRPT